MKPQTKNYYPNFQPRPQRSPRGQLLMGNEKVLMEKIGIYDFYGDESHELTREIRRVMQNQQLFSRVAKSGTEIEFAHFLMSSELLKIAKKLKQFVGNELYFRNSAATFSGSGKEKEGVQVIPDLMTYEGYSHLIIGERGLEVAIQELEYFEDFSDSPNKLVSRVEKAIYPVYLHYSAESCTPVFVYLNRRGRREMKPVSTSMKNGSFMEHMFAAYWGSGKTTFDYRYPPGMNIQDTCSNINPEYIGDSLQKAVKKLINRTK